MKGTKSASGGKTMIRAIEASTISHMVTVCPRYIIEKVKLWKIVPSTVFLKRARYGKRNIATKSVGIARATATGRHHPGGFL